RHEGNSKVPLDQYEAPRKAAVICGLMVQAKYFAVWSPTSSSGAPARKTSRLATTSIQRIAVLVWRYGTSRRDTIEALARHWLDGAGTKPSAVGILRSRWLSETRG